MGIVFHHGATAGGVDQNRFGACLDERPPGGDVAAGIVGGTRLIIEVVTDGPAASRALRANSLQAQAIEHAIGGRVN